MKFQFYGDSWYWCWNFSSVGLKSDAITTNLYSRPYHHSPDLMDCISFIEILLNKLGHESQQMCNPGQAFHETVSRIVSADYNSTTNLGVVGIPFDSTIDHHIIFYSGQMRGEDLKEFILANKYLPYNEFENKYYQCTVDDLILLGEHANSVNTKYIIAGGQSTLFQRVFNKVPSHLRKNLILLSECILESIQRRRNTTRNQPVGPFKLTDVIGREMSVPWDEINPDIVNNIHGQIRDFDMLYPQLTWPDNAHMSAGSVVVFLDILLAHIEGK